MMERLGHSGRIQTWLILAVLCLLILVLAVDLVIGGAVSLVTRGPKYAMSKDAPDKSFTAYVVDEPSIDGPNHTLYVERSNKLDFMYLGHLAGDVDSIRRIHWSPDSSIVVFESRCWLTAARVSDWKTVRLYLGREWKHTRPSRISTFTSGGVSKEVESVTFPKPGTFGYKLKGSRAVQFVDMSD